jgi:hypothetical protein
MAKLAQYGREDAACRCDGSNGVSVPALTYLAAKLVQRAGIHPYGPAARTHAGTEYGVSRHSHAGSGAECGIAGNGRRCRRTSVHAIVAALGLGVLISQAPMIYNLLRWTGVAYPSVPRLLYLAWET